MDQSEQLYVVVVRWPTGKALPVEGRMAKMSKAEAEASADQQRRDFSGMKPPPVVTVEEAKAV